MRRLIAILIALSIVFASTAWAIDLHEEALTSQHVAADQHVEGGDAPSEIPESCGHCCHGSGHHSALLSGNVEAVPVQVDNMRPPPFVPPLSRLQIPPTPPPDI